MGMQCLGDGFESVAHQSQLTRSSKQVRLMSISRAVIWYAEYSHTLYFFSLCMTEKKEEDDEQNRNFMFCFVHFVKG